MVNSNATNFFSPAKWVVSDVPGQGTHSTIDAAYTSAGAGDVIAIMPGSTNYPDVFTIKPDVILCGLPGSGIETGVIITGTGTLTDSGTAIISDVNLKATSANALVVSGSNICELIVNNSYVESTSGIAIAFTNSNVNSSVVVQGGITDTPNLSYQLYTKTSPGMLYFKYCNMKNTSSNTLASDSSAGKVFFIGCQSNCMISTSGSGNVLFFGASNWYTPQGISFNLLNTSGSYNEFVGGTINSGIYDCIYIGNGSQALIYSPRLEGGLTTGYVINGVSGGTVQLGGFSSVDNASSKSYKINSPPLDIIADVTDIGNLVTNLPPQIVNTMGSNFVNVPINIVVSNIDFTTTGPVLLVTPPVGYNFLLTNICSYYTNVVSGTTDCAYQIGVVGPTYLDYMNYGGTATIGVLESVGAIATPIIGEYFSLILSNNSSVFVSNVGLITNSTPLYANIITAAVATTAIGSIVIQGILIPNTI